MTAPRSLRTRPSRRFASLRSAQALLRPLAAAALLAAGLTWPADGQQAAHARGELLVQFRSHVTTSSRTALVTSLGGEIVRTQPVLGYVKVVLDDPLATSATLDALQADARIAWAEPNATYSALDCPNCPQDPYLVDLPDALPQNQWGVFKTGLPSLWAHGSGGADGVGIAIVDTGIDDYVNPHPDLAGNVAAGYDFVDQDNDPTDFGASADLYGHGTHVAGIAAATSNASGLAGVAYCSALLIVRTLDCTAGDDCPGTFEDIADGIQWAADNGGDIINLSLGGTDPSQAVRTAVQYAIAQGAIVVAASGNDGQSLLRYPARYPETIAVGASDPNDDVASFSNYGPELDVVAPGVDIYSTFPGPTYADLDGTSMATPFVAGVAALMRDRNPSMRQIEMERFLREHALPLAGANAEKDGYGRIAFMRLEDWSDAGGGYPAATHGSFFWERLGTGASAEISLSDPEDGDFRPNTGGSHDGDGYDDALFPESFALLPFLPPHIAAGSPAELAAEMSVCRFDGPRYASDAAHQLHLDVWADWDGDLMWEEGASGEHIVDDHTENPANWGGNAKIATLGFAPVDEHIWGNPLVVRSRLAYGGSAEIPDGPADFGEVEDDVFINFVEDFDVSQRPHTSGVYMSMGDWGLISDPMPDGVCAHHGDWEFAIAQHPSGGMPCNDEFESASVMSTPEMDWTEYTVAKLNFWYCHQIFNECSIIGDHCRVRIVTESGSEDLGPIPFGTGTVEFDLSDLVGHSSVRIEFVEETDWPGAVVIDDVVVYAFDGEAPVAVTDLALTRAPGSTQLDLSWTHPEENLFIPSPPAQPRANVYDVRYAAEPILTAAEFRAATPFVSQDLVAGAVLPATPGTPASATFSVPSALQAYHVALRTQDEVVNASLLSNSVGDPGDSVDVTLAVAVAALNDTLAAPGDTTTLFFRISNTGTAADAYALSAMDTNGFELSPNPGYRALTAGAASVFALQAIVPLDATGGEIDTVRLEASSLSDPSVAAADLARITVSGASHLPDPIAAHDAPVLRLASANPIQGALQMELELPAGGESRVRIYDPSGRLVREVMARRLGRGKHPLTWDGRDQAGGQVASGIYLVRLDVDSRTSSRRVVRIN